MTSRLTVGVWPSGVAIPIWCLWINALFEILYNCWYNFATLLNHTRFRINNTLIEWSQFLCHSVTPKWLPVGHFEWNQPPKLMVLSIAVVHNHTRKLFQHSSRNPANGQKQSPVFFSLTTTKTMTKMTKSFWIIIDETKTKTKIKTRDENEIEIKGILVLTTLTRISEAKFGTYH